MDFITKHDKELLDQAFAGKNINFLSTAKGHGCLEAIRTYAKHEQNNPLYQTPLIILEMRTVVSIDDIIYNVENAENPGEPSTIVLVDMDSAGPHLYDDTIQWIKDNVQEPDNTRKFIIVEYTADAEELKNGRELYSIKECKELDADNLEETLLEKIH